jgi:hypothetical protein
MAKRDEIFPSRFLRAADLKGKPVALTIESAPTEELNGGEETKTVLHFKKTNKVLPLNMTNWDSVADITGEDDSQNWSDCRIELYPTTTDFRGKPVDCIRIRAPQQRELPKPKPAPKPPLSEEMDDEIPF